MMSQKVEYTKTNSEKLINFRNVKKMARYEYRKGLGKRQATSSSNSNKSGSVVTKRLRYGGRRGLNNQQLQQQQQHEKDEEDDDKDDDEEQEEEQEEEQPKDEDEDGDDGEEKDDVNDVQHAIEQEEEEQEEDQEQVQQSQQSQQSRDSLQSKKSNHSTHSAKTTSSRAKAPNVNRVSLTTVDTVASPLNRLFSTPTRTSQRNQLDSDEDYDDSSSRKSQQHTVPAMSVVRVSQKGVGGSFVSVESKSSLTGSAQEAAFVHWREQQSGITTVEEQKKAVEKYVKQHLFRRVKFITCDSELNYTGEFFGCCWFTIIITCLTDIVATE